MEGVRLGQVDGGNQAMAPNEKQIRDKIQRLKKALPRPHRKAVVRSTLNKPVSMGRQIRRLVLLGLLTASLFALCFPPFFWPVAGHISSGFLFRLKPDVTTLALEIHHGIDLAAPRGTPVFASTLGIVKATGQSTELGNYVQVGHLLGFSTVYGHLNEIDVRPGQFLVPGLQHIGKVGSTGRATGPHLHFGIFFSGVALPPDVLLVFHSLRRWAVGF